jgi:hypothetical protein
MERGFSLMRRIYADLKTFLCFGLSALIRFNPDFSAFY